MRLHEPAPTVEQRARLSPRQRMFRRAEMLNIPATRASKSGSASASMRRHPNALATPATRALEFGRPMRDRAFSAAIHWPDEFHCRLWQLPCADALLHATHVGLGRSEDGRRLQSGCGRDHHDQHTTRAIASIAPSVLRSQLDGGISNLEPDLVIVEHEPNFAGQDRNIVNRSGLVHRCGFCQRRVV
jgi:hypothetical protein